MAAVAEFQQHHRAALAHSAAAAALVRGDGEAEQVAPRHDQQQRQRSLPQAGGAAMPVESGSGADEVRPNAEVRMDEIPVLDLQEQSSQLYG